MSMALVISAIAVLGGVGALAGVLLAYIGEKMRVEVDPRLEAVINALPGLNCGACGYAGCEAAAEAMVSGEAPPTACVVGGEEELGFICDVLGIEAGEKKVTTKPVVHCGKGRNNVEPVFEYGGVKSCEAVQLAAGGDIPCAYGCLGYGDCVKVCPFDAVHLGEDGLPVFDMDKCTRCGLCVKACPRNLIELMPAEGGIYVACSNPDIGKKVKEVCDVGCISCKLCERNCPNDAIHVIDGIARVDYDKCKLAYVCIEKCPTKCIKKI